jgi:ribose transport system ATP-binding protein
VVDQEAVRLDARGVSKAFGQVVALESADFDLRVGEVMALVGENGAGKSTFVKILCGIHRKDSGRIVLDGREVSLGTTARAERAGIAVVQQELSVVPTLSLAENLFLGQPGARFVMGRKWLRRHAKLELEKVGLDIDPEVLAGDLPLAERQMLEIARVISRNSKIVVFDEPTAALSDDDIQRVHEVVKRLAAEGRSVAYVTHRLGEVFEIADRVTVFRDGLSQAPVAVESLDTDELITRMLGRQLNQMFPPKAKTIAGLIMKVDEFETAGLAESLSFELRKGEILGLAGALGSGTSSLLRGLSGTQAPLGGRVTIEAEETDIHSPADALAVGMAYCSDDRKFDGFFGTRRVTENLTAPALRRIMPGGFLSRRRERQLASSLAAMVSVDQSRLRHRVNTLSGGNQQKVTLGKWLGSEPKILLINEPTRGVDVGARAEIYRTLRSLADEGLAVVFASSDMNEVLGLSDSVISFFRGRVVNRYGGEEATAELLTRDISNPTLEAGVAP